MFSKYTLSIALIVLAFGCGSNKDKSNGEDRSNIVEEQKPDEGAARSSWIDETEIEHLNSNWVDVEDRGELSPTWAEDAFDEESGDALANSWVDQDGTTVYKKTEIPPEFVGGKEALFAYFDDNIKYPEDVESGTVYVAFIVTAEGVVEDPRIVKGVKESMDREALRLINEMPRWDSGMQAGKPVDCVYGLPVIFRP